MVAEVVLLARERGRYLVSGDTEAQIQYGAGLGAHNFDRTALLVAFGDTNWFTVTAFRQLAINVAACVSKGDPVMVSGRLSVREWENEDRSGIVVEIDADSVGHDLGWGSSAFTRTIRPSSGEASGEEAGSSSPGTGEFGRVDERSAASDADASPDASADGWLVESAAEDSQGVPV
ncbi:single-stranded DNA-binding protein [Leifsonia sp. NPDC058248]|uniref:single-stranded DNA-binding protein n=1 Tax=Leifsonia sp. NPDC058248 TaxID=3346402 RepID=UPI0036DBF2C4